MSNAINVTTASFEEEVIKSEVPVLVDFWAPWCGPCRRLTPELDAVAAQLGDKVKIVKVNVDDETDLAARYQVQGIPLLLVFKEGKQVESMVGLRPRQEIAAKLGEYL
jgi:thioredoxin 1